LSGPFIFVQVWPTLLRFPRLAGWARGGGWII
jgi:hypothetical protein